MRLVAGSIAKALLRLLVVAGVAALAWLWWSSTQRTEPPPREPAPGTKQCPGCL